MVEVLRGAIEHIPFPERAHSTGIQSFSHNLLGGLHVPFIPSNLSLAQNVIAHATLERLPTTAINSVSTKVRKEFDGQFQTNEEKNAQHELWLGRKAQEILERAKQRHYRIAYQDILGLDVGVLQTQAKKEAHSLDEAARPKRKNVVAEPLPSEIVALVDVYQHFLADQQSGSSSGKTLSVAQDFSREFIEQALLWESVKDYLHTKVYVPFLREETDSKGLTDFALTNYQKAHPMRGFHVDDITQKAQLLYEDFDDMTAHGHTIIALIRSATVIATETQKREAEAYGKTQEVLSLSEQSEMDRLLIEQKRLDAPQIESLCTDIHTLTREALRMVKPVMRTIGELDISFTSEQVAARTEAIIKQFVSPLLSELPLLTVDPSGNDSVLDKALLYRLANIPDLLRLEKALSVAGKRREQMEQIALFRDTITQDPAQARIAASYTLEYFFRKSKWGNVARHLMQVLQESSVFQENMSYLQKKFGFLPEELLYIIGLNILQAEQGGYEFVQYGRSELGPRADTPFSNQDRYFQDDRFKFMMVADGAGGAKFGKSAAIIMQHVSQKALDDLAKQGKQYPLSFSDAQQLLIKIVGDGANMMWDLLPDDTKNHILKEAVDEQTGEIYYPNLDEKDLYFLTTFLGVVPFVEDGVEHIAVASVGDSRAYIHRANGKFVMITEDASYLWYRLHEYQQTAFVIDTLLSNFDGEIAIGSERSDIHAAVSLALHQEVTELSDATKMEIVQNMVDLLSQFDLTMTLTEMRTSAGEEKRAYIELQKLLEDESREPAGEKVTLDDKVAAVATFFYGRRNLLTKYVSIHSGYITEDDVDTYRMNPGDSVYIASDGVSDPVSQRRMVRVVNNGTSLSERVDGIHKETLAALGCERQGKLAVPMQSGNMSIRAKQDDGITFGGLSMTRRLAGREMHPEQEADKKAVA